MEFLVVAGHSRGAVLVALHRERRAGSASVAVALDRIRSRGWVLVRSVHSGDTFADSSCDSDR